MTILVNSKTQAADKNYWATTRECFDDAECLYGRKFAHDVCAEKLTSKCGESYWNLDNDGIDALKMTWPGDWWCNPPFDRKSEFIDKAIAEQRKGRPGMMLLPYEPLTGWWRRSLSHGVIIYEPDGRYNFLERDGLTKKQGVNFGCAFVCFPSFRLSESVRVAFGRGIATKK